MNKSLEKNRLPDEIIKAIGVGNVTFVDNWKNAVNIDDIDNNGRTMLFHAIINGFDDIVITLLESNPKLDLKDYKGWSPLHYAAQNHRVKIVELLLEKGVNKETKDDYGNTPLWRAVFASQGNGEVIKLLLGNGADRNNKNDSGISSLELASKIANYNIKQFFE